MYHHQRTFRDCHLSISSFSLIAAQTLKTESEPYTELILRTLGNIAPPVTSPSDSSEMPVQTVRVGAAVELRQTSEDRGVDAKELLKTVDQPESLI